MSIASLRKKLNFPLRISSANVTKSAIKLELITFIEKIISWKLHFLPVKSGLMAYLVLHLGKLKELWDNAGSSMIIAYLIKDPLAILWVCNTLHIGHTKYAEKLLYANSINTGNPNSLVFKIKSQWTRSSLIRLQDLV